MQNNVVSLNIGKRIIDTVVATALLSLLLPVIILCGLWVRMTEVVSLLQ